MLRTDLLPCPCCGKSDLEQWPCEWLDGSGDNVVRCAWCHCAAPMNTWNRRAAPPAQAVSVPEVPDGYELVPSSALRWLFGKEGDFECPASEYFHGNPAPFWWRREFRRRIYAAPAAATREGKS